LKTIIIIETNREYLRVLILASMESKRSRMAMSKHMEE
jgi:hypothetical protein